MKTETRTTRGSQQSRAILEELRGVTSHPRGDELYAMVRRRMPHISLGTVYRNLDRMRREGAALEIYCGDFVRYDGNTNPHDHFLCRDCRRVWDLDVPGEAPPTAVPDASAKGLAVEGRYTIYFGTCAECRGRPA